MVLLAKRVSASPPLPAKTSTSATPSARAAACTRSKTRSHSTTSGVSSAMAGPDLHVRKARRAGSMPGSHHLLGLTFAAVRYAPQDPMFAIGDGRTGVPEL